MRSESTSSGDSWGGRHRARVLISRTVDARPNMRLDKINRLLNIRTDGRTPPSRKAPRRYRLNAFPRLGDREVLPVRTTLPCPKDQLMSGAFHLIQFFGK